MKRVLITGATGFIGQHCLPRLTKLAGEVHAVAREISGIDPAAHIQWHSLDLLQHDPVISLIQALRPTHLLHLAWNVEEGVYWNAPENLRWLTSSIELCKAFYDCGGQRLVAAGTCAEYNLHSAYLVEDETAIKPESVYAGSKHAVHTALATYCQHAQLDFAWGRIFYLYGPHEKPGRLVPSVIRSLLARKPANCSHGNQIRDYLHVADVADAFVSLLNSNLQGAVNIASGKPVTLKEIIHRIAALIDNRQDLIHLGALPSPPAEPPVIIADSSRLCQGLDWQPRFDLTTGLQDTIEWWQNHMDWS